jgi:hypothetical protein
MYRRYDSTKYDILLPNGVYNIFALGANCTTEYCYPYDSFLFTYYYKQDQSVPTLPPNI